MATLTVNFTTSLNAVKYRVKYRVVGTLNYTTAYTTTSPYTLTVNCGAAYEGTVESICVEGIPCNRYEITNTGSSTGVLSYTDCSTGLPAEVAISAYATFYVCSRNTPVDSGAASTLTTVQQVAQESCLSPVPEEGSGPAYWTAAATACAYYYVVSVCPSSTNTTLPPNNEVKSNTPIPIGTVVQLTGSPYVDGCYTITANGTLLTSAVTVAQTFSNCNACIA